MDPQVTDKHVGMLLLAENVGLWMDELQEGWNIDMLKLKESTSEELPDRQLSLSR